jgi:hypothetical protein
LSESSPRFSCPACGQRFHWQPQFAGRAVKCKCGATFQASLGGTDLVENRPPPIGEDPPPPPHAKRVIASNLPPRAGRAIHEMASEESETGPIRDLVVPIALLAIGGIARFSQVLAYAGGERLPASKAIVMWICELLIGAAAMLGGALAVAGAMSTNFGPPARAVLKLLGIWLFAAAAACFVAKLDAQPMSMRGIILAFHVLLLIYFVGVAWLFKLDLQEALLTAVVVAVLQGLLLFGIARSLSPDAARALFFG